MTRVDTDGHMVASDTSNNSGRPGGSNRADEPCSAAPEHAVTPDMTPRRRAVTSFVVIALLAALLTLASEPVSATLTGPEGAHVVDVDLDPSGSGFWVADELGRVYPTDVEHFGEIGPGFLHDGERVVAIQATATGSGYWLFTSLGRVAGFGDAVDHGDLRNVDLAAPIVDAARSGTGAGYFLVGADGGIFGFGDAVYVGAGSEFDLRSPVNSLLTNGASGYWVVADDGGVLAFDAPFNGSAGSLPLTHPVVDGTSFSGGYLLLGSDGGVFNFAGGGFYGSLGDRALSAPAASITADGLGERYLVAQQDGVVWEFSRTDTTSGPGVGVVVARIDVVDAPMRISPVEGVTGTRDFRSARGSDAAAWSASVPSSQNIGITSSVDGSVQPAMWVPAPQQGRPLLVVLHSWSAGYDQQWSIPFAKWASDNGWAMIAPHFRGVNKQPTATGSDVAVADVVDAIEYAAAQGVDADRVFITGFSGGGHMALLMAGRHPELFAGVAAWVGVYDLPGWYRYNELYAPWRHYIPHIKGSCGGAPHPGTAAFDDCVARSPMAHLDAARAAGLPVYLAGGLLDSIVPPSQSARAFNQLAAPADRFTQRQIELFSRFTIPPELVGQTAAPSYFGPEDKPVVLTRRSGSTTFVLFHGIHEMMYEPALRWFAEGPPSGGYPDPPSNDVCTSPSNPTGNPDDASARGYWLLDTKGGVHGFNTIEYGELDESAAAAMSIQSTPSGNGYWIVDHDGVVHAFGDAVFAGDMSGFDLAAPITQIVANPAGTGYWLLAGDGGVFSFGDARFHGSTGALRLVAPVVSMEPTSTGGGYWLVAEDGGVFAFGDAPFHGSAGAIVLDAPVSSMAAAPDGSGYWLYAGDGGVFTYGSLGYHGSLPALGFCEAPRAAQLRSSNTGAGYWIATTDGRVFGFGDALVRGDRPALAAGVRIQDFAVRRG